MRDGKYNSGLVFPSSMLSFVFILQLLFFVVVVYIFRLFCYSKHSPKRANEIKTNRKKKLFFFFPYSTIFFFAVSVFVIVFPFENLRYYLCLSAWKRNFSPFFPRTAHFFGWKPSHVPSRRKEKYLLGEVVSIKAHTTYSE